MFDICLGATAILLGLPEITGSQNRQLVRPIFGRGAKVGAESNDAMRAYETLRRCIQACYCNDPARQPDGLVGRLWQRQVNRGDLDDEVVVETLTTIAVNCLDSLPTLMHRLISEFSGKPQTSAVEATPIKLRAAVEEGLRFHGPSVFVHRRLAADVLVQGRRLRAGDRAILAIGAANRDPAKFAGPDAFSVNRNAAGHLALGYGSHACLGGAFTRMATANVVGVALGEPPP